MHGVPYRLAEPILAACDASQLFRIEEANPEYMPHTDGFWKVHYERRFASTASLSAKEESKEGKEEKEEIAWRERYQQAEQAYNDKLDRSRAKLKRMYKADSDGTQFLLLGGGKVSADRKTERVFSSSFFFQCCHG